MYTIREIETSEIGLACRMVMAVFREFIASSLEFACDPHEIENREITPR